MTNWSSLAFRSALCASVASVAVLSAEAAQAQTRSFNVPAQPAASGVSTFGRQADVQILVSAEAAQGRRTNAVIGDYTVPQALDLLLRGTGLEARATGARTYSVLLAAATTSGATAEDRNTTFLPEILVQGQRMWSLNTDIRRSEDDAQPYVVFTADDIARSGAVSLDQFFRDFLGAATSTNVEETTPLNLGRGNVALRGLGTTETLVLVDGRRIPGANFGSGFLEQGNLFGIPLGQIERIEVLPSSASSVYGGGATGGVINIIMKRHYRGVELTTTYADVVDGGAADRRVDLGAGMTLEGGRTNISVSLNYRDKDPMLTGDRDYVERARRHFADVNPAYFNRSLIMGATPNIMSADGTPLRLDPAHGGGVLSSNHTFVPYGYRGVALDGVAPLIANAGQYNLDRVGTSQADGRGAYLTSGQETLGGSLAVRREFTPWLSLYGEAQAQRSDSLSIQNTMASSASSVTLAANAPNNPFQQAIRVAVPHPGQDEESVARMESRRFLAGAIISLPGNWQANLDYADNWSRFSTLSRSHGPDTATVRGFETGVQDILRDPAVSPLSYGFIDADSIDRRTPGEGTSESLSLRLAGPLPVNLPGGKPALNLLIERTEAWAGSTIGIVNGAFSSGVTYTPEREQVTESAYVEMRAPLFGPHNNIPLVHSLEFQVSARYDAYEGRGAANNVQCVGALRPLTQAEIDGACPPGGVEPVFATTSNSHVDPTYALRWQPIPDITVRASYGTGYLPPYLHQLVRQEAPFLSVIARDPERGGEAVGTPFLFGLQVLQGPGNYTGGNPELEPESSESLSAGVILEPRQIPGLRFSVDWTRIEKRNVFFNAHSLLTNALGSDSQAMFEDFLRNHPERFVRGPASGGFSVGPITAIDASMVNLSLGLVETVDFALAYSRPLWGGTLDFSADATWLRDLSVQQSDSAPILQWAGVANAGFQSQGGTGGVEWKGNSQVRWSDDRLTIGLRARYFGGYLLDRNRVPNPDQLVSEIPSQTYYDLFGTYALREDVDIRFGVDNILNTRPPLDVSTAAYYSRFGDPRRANYTVSLTKRF